MSRFGIIAFTAFIGFLTLFCIIYEYNLNFEEVLKYLLISIAIITVISVAITVCYICSSQIQTMIENKNAIHLNAETTSLGNYSLRSMNFRSNIAIIQMMERFSQFADCNGDKPLPTYTKAMVSSFPFNPTSEVVICTPPPPYTVIEMPVNDSTTAIMAECPPPPNYDNYVITDNSDDQLPEYSTSIPSTTSSTTISNN